MKWWILGCLVLGVISGTVHWLRRDPDAWRRLEPRLRAIARAQQDDRGSHGG